MKITKKYLRKLIKEEVEILLEGEVCKDPEECINSAMMLNAQGNAKGAFVSLVRALKLKGVI